MDERIFIIGLDGATWNLIDPWCAEGELPVLNNLIKNGTRSVLESTIVPISPVAWTSFATGMNPDKHGIFEFLHRTEGTYETEPYTSADRKSETLWSILSRKGKKVGVLNIPATYPVEKVNGVMVSGFPTPENLEDFTYPKNLLKELRKEIDKDFTFQPKVTMWNRAPFLEEINNITEYLYQATDYLMNNYSWDLFVSVFTGTDRISHMFWEYMDPEHPQYDAKAPQEFKHAILNIYKLLDKKIGALQKNIDPNTTLIIMSDHGFGPLYYGVSINNWLLKEGYISLKNETSTGIRYWLFNRGINYFNVFKLLKRLKGIKKIARANKQKSRWVELLKNMFLTTNDIDWNRTTVYSMGNLGQLYINLKGREPQGIIEPNEEYHELVAKIINKLKNFKDPNKNRIVFDNVYSKKEVYPLTEIEDDVPDIIFFDKEMKYSIYRLFEFGSKDIISNHPVWSGFHIHNGIFIAHNNEHILKGAEIENTSICDVTPTALHIMGIPIPSDMDGRVQLEIFKRGSKFRECKIVYQDLEKDHIKKNIMALKRLGKI